MRTLADLIPMRTAACRDAVDAVAMIAAGESEVEPLSAAHVETCLRCQAEVAAYRRVLAIMRAMRDDSADLPEGSLEDALAAMHAGAVEGVPVWAIRAAYVGGLTAAGAAGVLVWLGRRRLGLPHAS
jgi:hypothetical protein